MKRFSLNLKSSQDEWQKFVSKLHFVAGGGSRERFVVLNELLRNMINQHVDDGVKQSEVEK
jgi:hypothetical protein